MLRSPAFAGFSLLLNVCFWPKADLSMNLEIQGTEGSLFDRKQTFGNLAPEDLPQAVLYARWMLG
jgi:hypothetical protein